MPAPSDPTGDAPHLPGPAADPSRWGASAPPACCDGRDLRLGIVLGVVSNAAFVVVAAAVGVAFDGLSGRAVPTSLPRVATLLVGALILAVTAQTLWQFTRPARARARSALRRSRTGRPVRIRPGPRIRLWPRDRRVAIGLAFAVLLAAFVVLVVGARAQYRQLERQQYADCLRHQPVSVCDRERQRRQAEFSVPVPAG